MATPQDIKNITDEANMLSETLKNLVASIKDIAGEELTQVGEFFNNWTKKTNELKNLNQEISDQYATITNKGGDLLDFSDKINEGLKARRKLNEEVNKLNKYQLDLINGQKTQVQVDAQYAQVENLRNQVNELEDIITNENNILGVLQDQEKITLNTYLLDKLRKEQLDDFVDNNKKLNDYYKQNLSIDKQNAAKALFEVKIGNEKLNQLQQQKDQLLNNNNALKQTLGIWDNITGVLNKFSLTNIIEQAFSLNKALVETGKQLGVGSREAKELSTSYAFSAASSGTLASTGTTLVQTQKNILQASNDLNKSLGTSAVFSDNQLKSQVSLTKEMGFTVEEATDISKLSILNGIQAKSILDTVNNQTISLGKQQGIYLDNRKITADVAKVSGQLAAQYKNNPELLAKAVIETAKIGTNLQDAASAANNLLKFESSIENELKAELLTGKAINLEKARELALRGDAAGAAKELRDQVGSLSEFQNLNVIQQEALASAIGTSADKLADQLKMEELLVQTGDKSVASLNERRKSMIANGQEQEFYAELQRANTSEELIQKQQELGTQDKMNLLVEKLLETFGSLAEGPLNQVNKLLTYITKHATMFKLIATGIVGLMAGRFVSSLFMGVAQYAAMNAQIAFQNAQLAAQVPILRALKTEEAQRALASIAVAESSTLGGATPFILGGIAAVAAFAGLSSFTGGGGGGIGEYNTTTNANNENNEGRTSRPIIIQNIVQVDSKMNGQTVASSMHKSQNTIGPQ
jgi:hypothetical protein